MRLGDRGYRYAVILGWGPGRDSYFDCYEDKDQAVSQAQILGKNPDLVDGAWVLDRSDPPRMVYSTKQPMVEEPSPPNPVPEPIQEPAPASSPLTVLERLLRIFRPRK